MGQRVRKSRLDIRKGRMLLEEKIIIRTEYRGKMVRQKRKIRVRGKNKNWDRKLENMVKSLSVVVRLK
jgi:hypothetical protein